MAVSCIDDGDALSLASPDNLRSGKPTKNSRCPRIGHGPARTFLKSLKASAGSGWNGINPLSRITIGSFQKLFPELEATNPVSFRMHPMILNGCDDESWRRQPC